MVIFYQVVFGLTAFAAAIITGFFPETKGDDLPMTYDEAEDFFRKSMQNSKVVSWFGLPKHG